MENMKTNQKGITLVILVITIILMLILAAVTIEMGTESIDKSKVISFVSYMQTIQTKVDFIAEYEEFTQYGEALSSVNRKKLQDILNSENESFLTTVNSSYIKYFDSNLLEKDLGIANIDDEIVVDFETREVISLKGIENEGKIYYSQYNLPGGQTLVEKTEEVNREVSFRNIVSNVDGLNGTFTIENISITNGTLSCGQKDTSNTIKWTTITNYTTKGVSVTTSNITESGVYYFKLVDNTSGEDNVDSEGNYPSVELRLTNAPKPDKTFVGKDYIALSDISTKYNYSDLSKSEDWAYAKHASNFYVWIPRFVYKLNSSGKLAELQFMRGTSDVTTSGTYINTTEWVEPAVFAKGTTRNTGVWVKVNNPKQTRYRYN